MGGPGRGGRMTTQTREETARSFACVRCASPVNRDGQTCRACWKAMNMASGRLRGHFGVAIFNPKYAQNVGSLWRTADLLGADYFVTVGSRYEPQATDTMSSWKNTPMWRFCDFDTMREALPREALLVGVEIAENAVPLKDFGHPVRACYLFGAEDNGLPPKILAACHHVVVLPGAASMNLACAGSIVIYDRVARGAS